MSAAQVPNVSGRAHPADIPQFNWRQLAAFLLLPVAWWFILLYGITPLLLPALSAPNGWLLLLIQVLGYLFEFLLALTVFFGEGYPLRLRALKERIHWRWPRLEGLGDRPGPVCGRFWHFPTLVLPGH